MPRLPGKPPLGGWILSHDQVEAALMRRAGYEVRVIPVEGPSWEDNPPTLLDFTRRDLRWCQGNMQYLKLLALPGLPSVAALAPKWPGKRCQFKNDAAHDVPHLRNEGNPAAFG